VRNLAEQISSRSLSFLVPKLLLGNESLRSSASRFVCKLLFVLTLFAVCANQEAELPRREEKRTGPVVLKRAREQVLIRSALAAAHSYLTAYDRNLCSINNCILTEMPCPRGRRARDVNPGILVPVFYQDPVIIQTHRLTAPRREVIRSTERSPNLYSHTRRRNPTPATSTTDRRNAGENNGDRNCRQCQSPGSGLSSYSPFLRHLN
jgi:hypothetical protein